MKTIKKRFLSLLMAVIMAMPMILVAPFSANAADSVVTLFNYEFNNGSYSDSVNSSSDYNFTLINSWGTKSNSNGVLSFTDEDYSAHVNDNIRNATYKKHWKISMKFKYNNSRCRIEEKMLGLATTSGGSPFFGLANNGYVTVNGNNELNQAGMEFATPITGTDNNSGKKFNSSDAGSASYDNKYHVVAYEYNDGLMRVFYDGALVHTSTIADTTNFENLQYINIGGYSGNGSGLVVDYVKGEYIKNHIVGAYLTRNQKDGVTTGSGTVTWDNTYGAYFDGNSHLELDGMPFNSVSPSSGFTITFETRATEAVASDNSFILKFCSPNYAGNDRNAMDAMDYFGFRGIYSSNSDYRNNAIQYRTDWSDHAGIWTWDFYRSEYFIQNPTDATNTTYAADGSANTIVNPTTNTSYRYTISMDKDGSLYYYCNGLLWGKTKTDYYSSNPGASVTPTKLKTAFAKFEDYFIGKNYKGYIKNLYLFDSCLTDSQAQTEISGCTGGTISELESAINAYETKMNTTRNGEVYTNMGAAYQAYIMAMRAHDAYVYGNDTTINLSLYIDPLVRETAEMSEWIAWNNFVIGGTVHGATGNGANYTGSWNGMDYGWDWKLAKATHNVLYTGSEQNTSPGTDTQVGNSVATMTSSDSLAKTEIYYNTNVLLYTGGTDYPYFPVACRGFRNASTAVHMNAVYPSDGSCNYRGGQDGAHSAFEIYNPVGAENNTSQLKDNTNANATGTYFSQWSGHDGTRLCVGYIQGRTNSYFSGQRFNDNGNYSEELNNKRYYAASCLYYTTPSSALDTHYILWASATINSANKGASGYWSEKGNATASVATYVVNYKEVTDDLSDNLSKFSNITNYKAGGALKVLSGYQIDAGLDLSSGRLSDTANETASLKYQIETAHSFIGTSASADSASDYSGNYATYKSFLTTSRTSTVANADKRYTGTPEAAYNDGVNTVFTSASFSDYCTAYESAQAEMAKVLGGGYAYNVDMGTANTNLETAFDALEKSITYLPSVSAADTYLNATDTVTFNLHASDAASSRIHYTIDYDSDTDVAEQTVTDGTSIQLFNGKSSSSATVEYWSVNADSANSDHQTVTYRFLSAPSFINGFTALALEDGDDLTANDEIEIVSSNTSGYQLKYSIDYWDFTNNRWADSWTAYANADGNNKFEPFTAVTGHSKLRIKAIQTNETVTSAESTVYTIYKVPNAPTVTSDGTYLDKTHGITVSDNSDGCDGSASIQYKVGNGAWTNYSGKILPFSGKEDSAATETLEYSFRTVRNGIDSPYNYAEVKYLSRPTISKGGNAVSENDELLASDTLTIASTCGGSGTLKYAFSIDGGSNWSEAKTYSSAITPFGETVTIGGNEVALSNKVNVLMKAWEEADGSTSAELQVGPILLKKAEPLGVYYNADSAGNTAIVTSTSTYNDNGHFFINTDGYTGCSIYYQTKVDGGSWSGFTSYSINGGVDTDTFTSNQIVQIRFFVIENSEKTVFASGTFTSEKNYSDIVFKESFDSASKTNSTTLTLSGTNGTVTAKNADSFSVEDGAGYYDGSHSPDWRNNVLKINASGDNTNVYDFATNPLASGAKSYLAKSQGVTISFWRYVPDGSFTNTAAYWEPVISFYQPNGANNERYYFDIMESAYTTRSDGAVDGNDSYNKYVDIKPDIQDPTQHATGNLRNRWVNIVVTIDPASGVTVYTNGEPHNTTVTAGTGGTQGNFTGNNAALAENILDFITNANTTFSLANGHGYWSLGKDLYVDDIRIYNEVKTQVDINNMYIYDADVESDITSTSHDPTNVTVYTLAREVATDSNGTKPIGSKVGQEFIDYYGLDATDSDDVSAIDEYSFGTGMTIYHLNKTTGKWDVVGDDAGRCGYQNEKLFGSVYTTGIATALSAATGSGSGGGAGYLVWAPHVMYNLTTDKWVYYGSTSSWGVQKSAIFMCQNDTNDDVTGPYTYKELTYTSTGHPNAIDACAYYEYESDGNGGYKPSIDDLHFVFGSWGGNTGIAYKKLNANGTTTSNNSYVRIVATGVNEPNSWDGGSIEGAYVVFENGYYYLYVSVGQNTGSYTERVFRSTSPDQGFVDITGTASNSTNNEMKGNQIIGPFSLGCYDYEFFSTGHNSVYKTVNTKGEVVTLHSTHARPHTNENRNWLALPDNALATCQSEVNGNLNLINLVAYNSLGWPVLMPYQYDGTDTVTETITAAQLEGVYAANDLKTYVSATLAGQYNYTIVADETDPNAAFEYGTDDDGEVFTDYIVLSTGADGTRYCNYYASKSDYDSSNPNNNLTYCGVVGKHGDTIVISMINPDDKEHTWTYRLGTIPKNDEVNSLGDSVSMDGVIYTHKNNDSYALYGYEISDDFQYGTSDLHQGERCTTITTSYPAKIDTTNPTAIYCLSDEALSKTGEYSGGSFRVVALNDDKWFDDSGNKYTDAEAISREGIGTDSSTLHRRYGLQGYVSNYYFDSESGTFRDTGVELIVSYNDVSTDSTYSEYEFCYVSANPAMAHTIQGIRNQNNSNGDKRAGLILFDRFIGSSGSATDIGSSYVWDDSVSASAEAHETGTYNYLAEFGSSASTSFDYSSPSKTAGSFTKSTSKVGVNSGSYGLIEHDNDSEKSYTVSSKVVDSDYYIDYSNTDNYDINNDYGVITTSAGKPTGYKFTFRTSNIAWNNKAEKRWNATSYMLVTGDLASKTTTDSTYDSTRDTYVSQNCSNNEGRYTYGNMTQDEYNAAGLSDKSFLISGVGSASSNDKSQNASNFNGLENRYCVGLVSGSEGPGRKVMGGYYSYDDYATRYPNHDFYTAGFTKALPLIDSGMSGTNQWNMHIDFTGKESVSKNSDPGSGDNRAEKYANFIIEQGIGTFSYAGIVTKRYVNMEETYAYYNIGVHTCDKGAARSFAENYLRKKLSVTNNSDGTVTVNVDENGAPIYLDAEGDETTDVSQAAIINPSNYSLSSYQEYIDAVAELNYFVKNPTNTTFKDYANSGSNAATEYVTAYDNSGNPIYITSEGGKNIFGDSGTVNTDSVQATLIQNVITAYENLFSVDDYSDAQAVYAGIEFLDNSGEETATLENIVEIDITAPGELEATTYSKENFTDDTWEAFITLVQDVADSFSLDKTINTGKTSWRNVELSGSDYKALLDLIDNATSALMPELDTSELNTTIAAKTTVLGGGVGSNQTLESWVALKNEIDDAVALRDTNYEDKTYPVTGTEETKEFAVGKFDVDDVTKYTFGDVIFYAQNIDTSTPSDEQDAINTENTTLSGTNLETADTASAFESYDDAYTAVSSVNFDKYTEAGLAYINAQLDRRTSAYTGSNTTVYVTPTEEIVSAYNTATGQSITTSTQFKNLTTGVDSVTAALLSAINTIEHPDNIDTYVKKFNGYVTIKGADNSVISARTALTNASRDSSTNFYYGDTYTVEIPSSAVGKNQISITTTNPYELDGEDNPVVIGSQKVNYTGTSFIKNAVGNIEVTIKVTDNASSVENASKVLIKNIYGTVVDTLYVPTSALDTFIASWDSNKSSETLDFGSDITATAEKVPFYNFEVWEKKESADATIFKPIYSAGATVDLSITGADTVTGAANTSGTTYRAALDKRVSITAEDAYGWAAYQNGKYQIAAYGNTIDLYAVTEETFYPIYKVSSDYYVDTDGNGEGDVKLTASNVDVKFTVDADDNNALINQKLNDEKPFVSIITVLTEDKTSTTYSEATAYCRVTQNSSGYSEIGVAATNKAALIGASGASLVSDDYDANIVKGKASVFKTTTVLPTGQFTYTLRSSAGLGRVGMRGYISYDLSYTYNATDVNLNVPEYSGRYIIKDASLD